MDWAQATRRRRVSCRRHRFPVGSATSDELVACVASSGL